MRVGILLVGASILAFGVVQGPVAQPATPSAEQTACLTAPTGLCVAEMAIEAARIETEGWALTAAYEALIQFDPDMQRRDEWMKRYENWAATATVEGVKDRIVPVRAEHKARKGDFEGAYQELGFEQSNPETLGDPSTLILDEARSGQIKAALGRIDKLVEADSRDDIRLEMLEIAQGKSPQDVEAVVGSIKNQYMRRLGLAFSAGVRGDVVAIAPQIDDWVKTAKAGRPAPFDEGPSAKAESWDAFLRGAVAANNLDGFKAGLKKRGLFNQQGDGESAGRILRILIRDGRADWVKSMAPFVKLPKDEPLQVEEDLDSLKDMPPDKLTAIVQAAADIEATNHVITDLVVEMLAVRGETDVAFKIFLDNGRIAELNRGKYDQERVGITFETLWRAVIGRSNMAAQEKLKSEVTVQGAKNYMLKIEQLFGRMKAVVAGDRIEEPSEDDWSMIIELAQASNDPVLMTTVANAIREPGLRSSALVQVARVLWDRKS